MVQQWELGQGKGVARGNPGLIIQSLDDYTSNWYGIYKLDLHIVRNFACKKQFGCQEFCHSTQNCIQLNHHIHSMHQSKSVTTNIKSVKTHNNYIGVWSHYTTVDCNIKQTYTQSSI